VGGGCTNQLTACPYRTPHPPRSNLLVLCGLRQRTLLNTRPSTKQNRVYNLNKKYREFETEKYMNTKNGVLELSIDLEKERILHVTITRHIRECCLDPPV
jgi:hypothetical protein